MTAKQMKSKQQTANNNNKNMRAAKNITQPPRGLTAANPQRPLLLLLLYSYSSRGVNLKFNGDSGIYVELTR